MGQHLFIDNRECRLKLEGKCLVLTTPGRPPASVPLHMLEQVTLLVDIDLSSQLIHKLCSQGVGFNLISTRSKGESTQCVNLYHGNHQRRLRQYQWVLDDRRALAMARILVRWKLLTQQHALQRYGLKRPELAGRMRLAAEQLAELGCQFGGADEATLLGLEGAASRAYFTAYGRLFAESLAFSGRNRRPPRDPVNAALSLTYTLLTNECARALQAVGLDPAFGIYHRASYSRPSLACDVVELVRTRADQFVWRLFAEQTLRGHHFSRQLNACLLKKEGRELFFPSYQIHLAHCRGYVMRLARRLVKYLEAEA